MTKKRRPLLTFSSIASILFGLAFAAPASADVPLPVQGSLTVTVPGTQTPITLTAGNPTPAMTYTAFGIGLSGFPDSTNFAAQIQVRPSSSITWNAEGWSPKNGCPIETETPTTTLSACGISAVFIDDVDVTSNAKVYVQTSGITNSFIINSVSGNFINDVDAVGTVRVELDAGAWTLDNGANTTRGFGMWVRSATTSQQGTAYSNTRSVVFNPNGGTGSPYTQTWTKDATRALSPNLFTRSGYTLSEWNTEQNGTGDSYAPGANYIFATNQNLYAQWTANSAPNPGPSPHPNSSVNSSLATTGSDHLIPLTVALVALILGGLLIKTKRKVR